MFDMYTFHILCFVCLLSCVCVCILLCGYVFMTFETEPLDLKLISLTRLFDQWILGIHLSIQCISSRVTGAQTSLPGFLTIRQFLIFKSFIHAYNISWSYPPLFLSYIFSQLSNINISPTSPSHLHVLLIKINNQVCPISAAHI